MNLDDLITQDRKELECHPIGDAGRADALYNLALSLGNRFIKEKSEIADIDESIALHRSALDLRPLVIQGGLSHSSTLQLALGTDTQNRPLYLTCRKPSRSLDLH